MCAFPFFLFGFLASSLFAWWFFKNRYTKRFTSQINQLESENSKLVRELRDSNDKFEALKKKHDDLEKSLYDCQAKLATTDNETDIGSQVADDQALEESKGNINKLSAGVSTTHSKSKAITESSEEEAIDAKASDLVSSEAVDSDKKVEFDETVSSDKTINLDEKATQDEKATADIKSNTSTKDADQNALSKSDVDLDATSGNIAKEVMNSKDVTTKKAKVNTGNNKDKKTQDTAESNFIASVKGSSFNSSKELDETDKAENIGSDDLVQSDTVNSSLDSTDTSVLKISSAGEASSNTNEDHSISDTKTKTIEKEVSVTDTTFDKAAAKKALGKNIKLDDLKLVEGIGPKICGLFHDAGIKTWLALSETKVDDCKKILTDAGSRYKMHDPTTWPEQAGLAAAGKWEELAKLQDELKGGRRSS